MIYFNFFKGFKVVDSVFPSPKSLNSQVARMLISAGMVADSPISSLRNKGNNSLVLTS